MDDARTYFSQAGLLTEMSKHKAKIDALTANPEAVCQIVQGLMLHGGWFGSYGLPEKPEVLVMRMDDLLDRILGRDPRSLAVARLPEDRVIACCREFAVLSCAILRLKGVPARARCGFATYLDGGGGLGDHWIVEYWDGRRWIMNDPQIDPLQLSQLQRYDYNEVFIGGKLKRCPYAVNPHDLSNDNFIIAGRAWKQCRRNEMYADKCGIDDLRGLWFIRGQLLRDFAALNKVEVVPHLVRTAKGLDWSSWRLVAAKDDELTEEDWNLLDRIAELTLDADRKIKEMHELYLKKADLQAPAEIVTALCP